MVLATPITQSFPLKALFNHFKKSGLQVLNGISVLTGNWDMSRAGQCPNYPEFPIKWWKIHKNIKNMFHQVICQLRGVPYYLVPH